MSLKELTTPFPWANYSKKLKSKIDHPKNCGYFKVQDAEARGVAFASSMTGSMEDGNAVSLYWFVDKEDGVIIDAKFQVYGQSALIGAAEAACDLLVGKNYSQAKRIGADLIDKQLRDHANKPSFPKETYPHLNLVIDAIEEAADQCADLPVPEQYVAPPVPLEMRQNATGNYPEWDKLNEKERLALIEAVFDQDIRPYIALDGGGVQIVELKNALELIISYQGNCTSCFSAVGTTLSYIQQVLRAQIHPNLIVTPEIPA